MNEIVYMQNAENFEDTEELLETGFRLGRRTDVRTKSADAIPAF